MILFTGEFKMIKLYIFINRTIARIRIYLKNILHNLPLQHIQFMFLKLCLDLNLSFDGVFKTPSCDEGGGLVENAPPYFYL
mgnify:CR=1 FL=1